MVIVLLFLSLGCFSRSMDNKLKENICTDRPAPSCPPCPSPTVDRGHPLVASGSVGIYSGPGSGPLTSGSVAAVTRCLTRPRPPCCLGQGLVKLANCMTHYYYYCYFF